MVVSAAAEGGATFTVRGQPGTPLQVACLACGDSHSAATTIEGELYAWGRNADGQLGLGDRHDRGFPHRVRGLGADLASCGFDGAGLSGPAQKYRGCQENKSEVSQL